MPIINLPPEGGDVAFFLNIEPDTRIVFTLTECPKNLFKGKHIFYVTKDDKIIEKGCWDEGKEPGTIATITVERNTNEPAPYIFPVEPLKEGIKT